MLLKTHGNCPQVGDSNLTLAADQILECFPPANEPMTLPSHEHLRSAAPAVVIRAHRHPVRPGTERRQEIACLKVRQPTIARQVVARFADRPDDIALLRAWNLSFIIARRRG